jgi:hypothetical protein
MFIEDLYKVYRKLGDIEELLKDCIGFAISVSAEDTIEEDGSVSEVLVSRLVGMGKRSIEGYRETSDTNTPTIHLPFNGAGDIFDLLIILIKSRKSIQVSGSGVTMLSDNIYSYWDGARSFIIDYRELEVLYNGFLEHSDKRDWI